MRKKIFNYILSIILTVSFVPGFANANLKEDYFGNFDDEYTSVDLSSIGAYSLENDTEFVAFESEDITDSLSIIPEKYFNFASTDSEQPNSDAEIKACAYYVSKEIPGYEANTLYFYGYENPELENNDNVTKYEWANTNPNAIKSPFENASQNCTGILFDVSASNIRPVSCRCWFMNFGKCLKVDGFEYLNTGYVNDMSYMFNYFAYRATNPPNLDLSNWDTSNVVNMSNMFSFFACNALDAPNLNVSNWNTSNVKNMSSMFSNFAYKAKNPPNLDLSNWNTSNVVNMSYMFCAFSPDALNSPTLNVSNWDTSNVDDMSNMFNYFSYSAQDQLTLDVSNWNTSNVKNMSAMFYLFAFSSQNPPILNVSNWDTSNVTDMSNMFYYFAFSSQTVPTLNVSNWDTSNVVNMSLMFCYFAANAQNPPILNVSNWDTSNVVNMSYMFCHFAANAQNPPILNVSNWDTSNVVNMSNMFSELGKNSTEPATIYASDKFIVSENTSSGGMFAKSNIQGGAGTTYDSEHINGVGACVDKLDGKWGLSKGYFTGDTAAIEFYANGADGIPPAPVMYFLNSEIVLPNKGQLIDPDGFAFTGWAIGSTSGEVKQPDDVITINKYTPIYAVWNKIYSVTLNTNGGIITEGCNVTFYAYGQGAKLPNKNEIFKTNYIFEGWFSNIELSGDPVSSISKNDTGNKEYWAKWTSLVSPNDSDGVLPYEAFVDTADLISFLSLVVVSMLVALIGLFFCCNKKRSL